MKKLYIIRHAKSSWDNPALSDFDRPLNDRGKRDAPFMGKKLAERGVKTDLMITSPAKRAFRTAKIIAEAIGYKKKSIIRDESIYLGDVNTVLEVIHGLNDTNDTVMIFGHNPGFTYLANYLTNVKIDNIPTCGIFCIDFKADSWKEVAEGTGECKFFDYPKKYV